MNQQKRGPLSALAYPLGGQHTTISPLGLDECNSQRGIIFLFPQPFPKMFKFGTLKVHLLANILTIPANNLS